MRYEANLPRLFRARGIAQAAASALQQGRKISVYRTYAPNRYQIALAPPTLDALKGDLEKILAAARKALEEEQAQTGFYWVGPLDVSFLPEQNLAPNRFVIYASFSAPKESPRRFRLRLLSGSGPALVSLGDSALVGRVPEAEVRCHENNTVSRKHARLFRRDGALYVADLDSDNGTYVNGQKIKEQRLAPGDRIGVGNADFVLEVDE